MAKVSWAPKNCCFWTVVLEKTLESPLDCKEIQSVYPKGNQSWLFIGRTDAEAETPILWPPKYEELTQNWYNYVKFKNKIKLKKKRNLKKKKKGRTLMLGKDWRQEEKGMTEDEMVGWHHQLDRYEFGKVPGVDDRQGSLACCNLWGRKEPAMTEWLNWTEEEHTVFIKPYQALCDILHKIFYNHYHV